MIEFKKNYFKRNAIDCDCSVKDYILDSYFNYVVLENGVPLIWGDRTPVIYGDIDSLNESLSEMNMLVNGKLIDGVEVITELEFINEFCQKELEKLIIDEVKQDCNYDGVTYIKFLDANNLINEGDEHKMTDILNVCVSYYCDFSGFGVSYLISDADDKYQTYVGSEKFNDDVLFDILCQIF